MPHTFPSSTSPSGAYVSAVTPPTSLSVMHATTSSSANNNNNPPSTTTSSSTPPPPSTSTPTPSSNNNNTSNTNNNNNPSANASPTIATSPSYSTSNLSLNSTLGHASSPPSHHHHHSHHQHPIQQQQQSSLHHSPYPQQTPPISPIHQTSPNQNNANLATTTTSSSMGSPLLGGLSSSSSHPLHHLQHHHQQQQPQQYSGNNSPYHYPQYPSPQHHQQQPPLQPHQSSQQQIQLQLQQHQQILFEHNNNTSGSSSNGSHKQLALHPTNNNNPDSNSSDAGDYPYGISGMLVGSATAIGGVVAIGRGGDGGGSGSSRDHLLSASNTNKQSASMLSSSRKRGRFSPDEDQKILVGVTKFYDDKKKNVDWDKLIKWSELGRTKDQVKNRYTRLSRKPINIPSMSSASDLMDNLGYMSPVHAVEYDDHAPSIVHSGVAPASAAASHQHALPSSNNNSNNNNTNEEPALKKQKTIHDYVSVQPVPKLQTQPPTPRTPTSSVQPGASMFGTVQESPIESMGVKSEPISTSLSNSAMLSDVGATSGAAQVNKMNGNTNGTMNGTTETSNTGSASNIGKKVVSASDQQQRDLIQQLYKQIEEKDKKIVSCEKKIKDYDQKFIQLIEEQKVLDTTRTERYCNSLIEVLTKLAEQERKDDKDRMNQNSIRIGTITYQKTIGDAFEVWQDGEMFIDLERRQAQVTAEKERLEKMKKQLQKQRANVKKGSSESQQSSTSSSVASASTSALQALMPAPSAPSSSTSSISSISQNDILINDINEQEEILKLRLNQIKKDETIITAEREKLLISKSIQIREIKRIRDQERSRFKNPTLIQKRYFLMKLLGRGGFSEVYKAYDLIECRIVACKIHQINANWKENRKENYIKHVLRECQIHKSVKHPRLIQMFDTFILDNNTFVTVLEFCDGYDLDLYIKKHQKIPEKEAKNIIAQVFSGLAYLNQQKNKIIHFDLKPANILFMDGQIKITDFGLSKIMEEEESIELTSQGAGTYWYLPPECFEQGNTPKISPKVDVWSAGVVLYQMLFGKKPFGNDLSQQKILSEKTIINARTIVFPPKPVISEECKDFIRKCLTYNPSERPDVLTIYNDKYLRSTKTK